MAEARKATVRQAMERVVAAVLIVLYQVSMTTPPGGESSADAQRLFSSFALPLQ